MKLPKIGFIQLRLAKRKEVGIVNQETGNKGQVPPLMTFPSRKVMLSIFVWHHFSWEDEIIAIFRTLETSFRSIIVNDISFCWESSAGSVDPPCLIQHFFFPCKSFNSSTFYRNRKCSLRIIWSPCSVFLPSFVSLYCFFWREKTWNDIFFPSRKLQLLTYFWHKRNTEIERCFQYRNSFFFP